MGSQIRNYVHNHYINKGLENIILLITQKLISTVALRVIQTNVCLLQSQNSTYKSMYTCKFFLTPESYFSILHSNLIKHLL